MTHLITIHRSKLASLESQARALADEIARLSAGYGEPMELASEEDMCACASAITAYHMRADARAAEAVNAFARAHGVTSLRDLPSALVRDVTECYSLAVKIHDLCEDTRANTANRYIASVLWRGEVRLVWELPLSIWRTCAQTLANWPEDKRASHITDRIARVVAPVGVQP